MKVALILLVTLALIALIEAAPAPGEKKGKTAIAPAVVKGKSAKAGKTAGAGAANKKGSRGMGEDEAAAPADAPREARSANEHAADAETVRKPRSPQDPSVPDVPSVPSADPNGNTRILGDLVGILPAGKSISGKLKGITGALGSSPAAPKKKAQEEEKK